MPVLHIPAGMRHLTAGEASVTVAATTLGEAVEVLEAAHPGTRARIVSSDDPHRLRPGLAAFVDGVQAPAHSPLRTRLQPASEVYFTPAIAGG